MEERSHQGDGGTAKAKYEESELGNNLTVLTNQRIYTMKKELEYFQDQDLEFNQILASHHGRGKSFELKVNHSHLGYLYIVTSFGRVVYEGRDSMKAVDAFNDLPH